MRLPHRCCGLLVGGHRACNSTADARGVSTGARGGRTRVGGPPEGLRGRHTGRLRGAPCTCQRVQSGSNRPTRCRLDPYAARAGPRARPGRPQRPTPLPRARRPGRRPVREGGARAPRPVQHVPAVPAGAGVASEGARSWARSHPSAPGARTLESPPGADGGCAGSPGNLLRYSGCLGGTWNGSGMSPYMLSSPAYPDMMPVQPRSSVGLPLLCCLP